MKISSQHSYRHSRKFWFKLIGLSALRRILNNSVRTLFGAIAINDDKQEIYYLSRVVVLHNTGRM